MRRERRMAVRRVALMGAMVGAAAGCGALFNSGPARVNFTSSPDGAEVWVDGTRRGTTPVFVELEKRKDHTVVFRRAGYQDFTNPLPRSVRGLYVVLDVLGGVLPVVVDAATGAWYVLSTDHVHANLQQATGVLTPDQLRRVLQGTPVSEFVSLETVVGPQAH